MTSKLHIYTHTLFFFSLISLLNNNNNNKKKKEGRRSIQPSFLSLVFFHLITYNIQTEEELSHKDEPPALGRMRYKKREEVDEGRRRVTLGNMPPEMISHIGGFLDLQSRASFAASSTQQRQGIERFEEMVNLSVGRFLSSIQYNYNAVYSNYLDKIETGTQYVEYNDNDIIKKIFVDCLMYVYDSLGIPRDHIVDRTLGFYIMCHTNIRGQDIQFPLHNSTEYDTYYDFSITAKIRLGAFYVERINNRNTTLAFSLYLPMLLYIFETIISRMGFRMVYTSRYARYKFSRK